MGPGLPHPVRGSSMTHSSEMLNETSPKGKMPEPLQARCQPFLADPITQVTVRAEASPSMVNRMVLSGLPFFWRCEGRFEPTFRVPVSLLVVFMVLLLWFVLRLGVRFFFCSRRAIWRVGPRLIPRFTSALQPPCQPARPATANLPDHLAASVPKSAPAFLGRTFA